MQTQKAKAKESSCGTKAAGKMEKPRALGVRRKAAAKEKERKERDTTTTDPARAVARTKAAKAEKLHGRKSRSTLAGMVQERVEASSSVGELC